MLARRHRRGTESRGGSQTSLTSLPFFFCQEFIKRKCSDVKTLKGRGQSSCIGLLAEPYLFLQVCSIFHFRNCFGSVSPVPCVAGKTRYQQAGACEVNAARAGSSASHLPAPPLCGTRTSQPREAQPPSQAMGTGSKPEAPAASNSNSIMFLLPLHVEATKPSSPKHALYCEEPKGHVLIENMKKQLQLVWNIPRMSTSQEKGPCLEGRATYLLCV